MRNLLLFALLLSLTSLSLAQTPSKRLFMNLGAGPSYSLYHNGGGWVRDWGPANTANIRQSRQAWAFSHFAEVEYRLKNSRWSVRLGYAMHHFFPRFNRTGFTAAGTYYDIDTDESDRYLYIQPTVHYALLEGNNRLEIGTGGYIRKRKTQMIHQYNRLVSAGNPTGQSSFEIRTNDSEEAGFPFNLDYVHTLKSGNGLGFRANFNYTQSLRTAEHLAAQIFFKVRLD